MDVVKKLNDDFLTCSICTDRYTDPCTLGCGHTFCRDCLGKFTKTRQDAIRIQSILCPNCRQMSKVPDPTKPAEDWPKQMKPHFLIQGLLDEFAPSGDVSAAEDSADTTSRQCYECHQKGKTSEARLVCQECRILLCEVCVRNHRQMPASRHHVILDEHVSVKEYPKITCKEHKTIVEFCCKKCNKLVCSKCGIIYHGKCGSVVTIESMATDMKSLGRETKHKVMRTLDALQTNLALQQSFLETVGQNKSAIQSEIKQASQHAIDLIRQDEKKLMDELEELVEKQTEQMKGQIKSCESDVQMYQHYCEFIDKALRSESQMAMYDMFQMCQTEAVRAAVDREMSLSAEPSYNQITFVDTNEFITFFKRVHLGRLEVPENIPDLMRNPTSHAATKDENARPGSNDTVDLSKTPRLCKTISVRTKSDKMNPSLFDVTVLEVNGIETVVVTDFNNKSIKSFYTRGSQPHSSVLSLIQNPSIVSKLNSNQVIVSFWHFNELCLVSVNPDLVLVSMIPTQKAYKCVTALSPDTIAAGWNGYPSGIDIVDLSGRILRSITTDQKRTQDLEYLFITNKGYILVADDTKRAMCVFCITSYGEVIFAYRTVTRPRGITATPSGDILYVDYDRSKVTQLSESGQFVRHLLTSSDGLQNPRGLCLYRNRLFVAESRHLVKVFNFH